MTVIHSVVPVAESDEASHLLSKKASSRPRGATRKSSTLAPTTPRRVRFRAGRTLSSHVTTNTWAPKATRNVALMMSCRMWPVSKVRQS